MASLSAIIGMLRGRAVKRRASRVASSFDSLKINHAKECHVYQMSMLCVCGNRDVINGATV